MDLRQRRRYRLALPVVYFWGTGEKLLQGSGTTRDISVSSVYVTADETVPAGSDVWLQVSVPPMKKGARGSKLEGTGQVTRSEDSGFVAVASIGFPMDVFRAPETSVEMKMELSPKEKAAVSLAFSASTDPIVDYK